MSYSVKRFIKKNCTEKYDIKELKKIAAQITTDSAGRYTDNSALKILCRYAYIQNNKIMFNVDCRDSDQTLAKIESKLNLSLKTNPIQDKSNDLDAGLDIAGSDNDGSDNDGSDIEDVRPAKKLISKSTQATKTPAKGGFGNLSSMKKIINLGAISCRSRIYVRKSR